MSNLLDDFTVKTNQMTDLRSSFFKESHHIVFGRLSLSSIEHDLFALFLTRLNKEHWEDFINGEAIRCPQYTFNSDVLSEWFKIKKIDLCTILKPPCARLSSQKLGIEDDENSRFLYMPLFKKVEFSKGLLTLVPNDELLEQYLCVSQGHSQISHVILRSLKREASKRIYGLLCRFQHKGNLHTLPLIKIQSILGLLNEKNEIHKKTYENPSNLVRFIIKPAIEEIANVEPRITFFKTGEKKSDYVGFSMIKSGTKIVGIKFNFEWQKDSQEIRNNDDCVLLTKSEEKYILAKRHAKEVMTYQDDNKLKINFSSEDILNIMSHSDKLTKELNLPEGFWKHCGQLLSKM